MKSIASGIDTAAPIGAELAAEIKAAGYEFVLRYLAPEEPLYNWKRLTAPESKILSDAGLLIGAVYETSAGRVRGGAANGKTDGAFALACAEENRMPESGCIYFAVDMDVSKKDYDNIEAYLIAAKRQIGNHPIGVYGEYEVIEEMFWRDACDYFWQCVGWSGGLLSSRANIYQHAWDRPFAGITVDFDNLYSEAGLWTYGEDDMTGEQIAEKLNEYYAEQPCPDWAQAELQEAIDAGITDGTRPCALIPRYQAAIMAKRAKEGK